MFHNFSSLNRAKEHQKLTGQKGFHLRLSDRHQKYFLCGLRKVELNKNMPMKSRHSNQRGEAMTYLLLTNACAHCLFIAASGEWSVLSEVIKSLAQIIWSH